MGRAPSVLSRYKATSVTLTGRRFAEPWKMTSSIFPPRSRRADCSPSTQRTASETFDLPQPLGPTMAVTPSSKSSVTVSANDLKPESSSLVSFMQGILGRGCGQASLRGLVLRGDDERGHAEALAGGLGLVAARVGTEHDPMAFLASRGRQHRGRHPGTLELVRQLVGPRGIP